MRQTLELSAWARRGIQPAVVVTLLGAALCLAAGGDAARAEDRAGTVIVIAPADCAGLTAHVPDESVDYVPGVDVQGRPVVPADLPGHEPLRLDAAEIGIDPRIPLSAYYDPPASLAPVNGDAEILIGRITVRDGVAYLGDRALGDPQQAAIARACAERLRERP